MTLSLIEDKDTITELTLQYLDSCEVKSWKFEELLSKLFDQGLIIAANEDTTADEELKALGQIYLSAISELYDGNEENYTQKESDKIQGLKNAINTIALAPQIKQFFKENNYKSGYVGHLKDSAINEQMQQQQNPDTTTIPMTKFHTLNNEEKLNYLVDHFGAENCLDLTTTCLAKRYIPYMKFIRRIMNLSLSPAVTLEEREVLLEIVKCKSMNDVNKLISQLYAKEDATPNIDYIRFSLAAAAQLWNSNALLKEKHGEDWYRLHVYSNVFDKLFIKENEFESKRSECYSNITRTLKCTDSTIRNQRLDFILRELNNERDILSTEEKPGKAGVKGDLQKGKKLQKHNLDLWSKNINSSKILQQLECISCQWAGTSLILFGSRILSSGKVLQYRKASYIFPKSVKNVSEFAQLLMGMISLKRLVLLNYDKFNLVLMNKINSQISNLDTEDIEIEFRSDSTAESFLEPVESTNHYNEDEVIDQINKIGYNEDGKTYADWEELVLATSK